MPEGCEGVPEAEPPPEPGIDGLLPPKDPEEPGPAGVEAEEIWKVWVTDWAGL